MEQICVLHDHGRPELVGLGRLWIQRGMIGINTPVNGDDLASLRSTLMSAAEVLGGGPGIDESFCLWISRNVISHGLALGADASL